DVDKKKRAPGDQPISWPKAEEASRAVREYLAVLDAACSDEESGGGDDSGSSGGGSRGKPAKEVSVTDPQAAWVARKGVDPFFAYDANYLIDNKAGIIVDAEGTRANRTAEIAITETMIDRVQRRFDLCPQRLAGDSVYGAARLLKALVDRKITPHVPGWDKSARHDGTFSRSDFVFDQERNVYICPGGAELTSTGNIDQGHILYYRANKNDCSACLLKPKCTTAPMRKVTRDVNEDVRDCVRALANTEAFQQSRRERKKVEGCAPSCSTGKSWLHFRPPPVDFCSSRLAIGAATERARALAMPAGTRAQALTNATLAASRLLHRRSPTAPCSKGALAAHRKKLAAFSALGGDCGSQRSPGSS